jgi:hypothetical protein
MRKRGSMLGNMGKLGLSSITDATKKANAFSLKAMAKKMQLPSTTHEVEKIETQEGVQVYLTAKIHTYISTL